jgi:hypothetical protein
VSRVYGDEAWRLALAGDAERLRGVSVSLVAGDGDPGYEGHRALAFALAVESSTDAALAELNEGWTEDWPFPAAYAADIARVRFLVGDYAAALDALGLSVSGADRVEGAVLELLPACVRRDPSLWRRALRVAFAGGTPWQRLGTAARVVAARL